MTDHDQDGNDEPTKDNNRSRHGLSLAEDFLNAYRGEINSLISREEMTAVSNSDSEVSTKKSRIEESHHQSMEPWREYPSNRENSYGVLRHLVEKPNSDDNNVSIN